MWKYKILKPEDLWFLQSDVDNPDFIFSLDWKTDDEIKILIDNGIILLDNTSEPWAL